MVLEELRKIVKYEEINMEKWAKQEKEWKEKYGTDWRVGWTWQDVGIHPSKLAKLVLEGWLEVVYKSNRATEYRLKDFQKAKEYVEGFEQVKEAEKVEPEQVDTSKLFENIVGFDDVKELFRMAIEAPKQVHCLMVGPPATSKSIFLLELAKLPGAVYVTGSGTSSAGLEKILIEKKPNYLLIDEIDKLKATDDISVLLSLMETGKVIRAKGDWQAEVQLNTKVFAAGNKLNLPRELADRFIILHFKEYTYKEFKQICVEYFSKEEGVSKDFVAKVVDFAWEYDKSVRTVRSLIRLSAGKEERLAKALEILKKYS